MLPCHADGMLFPMGCRVVRTVARWLTIGPRTHSCRLKGNSHQVVFGNTQFYIFFRVYQILFQRLYETKAAASAQTEPRAKSLINGHIASAISGRVDADGDSEMSGGGAPASTSAPAEGRRDTYGAFVENVFLLLDGTIDTSRFEEECRSLLGATSFQLYTVDKVPPWPPA